MDNFFLGKHRKFFLISYSENIRINSQIKIQKYKVKINCLNWRKKFITNPVDKPLLL